MLNLAVVFIKFGISSLSLSLSAHVGAHLKKVSSHKQNKTLTLKDLYLHFSAEYDKETQSFSRSRHLSGRSAGKDLL